MAMAAIATVIIVESSFLLRDAPFQAMRARRGATTITWNQEIQLLEARALVK